MRIFEIRDAELEEELKKKKVLGYLIYYKNAKAFYIELPDDADPWETPLLLSSFASRGQYSIDSYWSGMWVEQRIVPRDRQNIGSILRDNGLSEYDEFQLLTLAKGRCAQDACYIKEISNDPLPKLLEERWSRKVEDVIPIDQTRLLIFFRTGEVRVIRGKEISDCSEACIPYTLSEERFRNVEVQPDGYGIWWNERARVSCRDLYTMGAPVPLSINDFCSFVQQRVLSVTEAAVMLGCSRQNIDDLTRRGKLHPIRTDAKNKLYLRTEVLQRKKA